MRWIVLTILMFLGFIVQGQSWTVNVDTLTCRIDISNAVQSYHFLAEKTRYIDRNNNLILFDDRRSAGFTNEMITNYANFTLLKADLDSWFETCNVVSAPVVPPGLTPLFANQKSIDLDGTAEYVEVADADDLSMTEGGDIKFTLSAWVYLESSATPEKIIAKNQSGLTEYLFYLSSGKPTFYLYDESASAYIGIQYNVALSANEWHHLAVAYNASGNCGVPGFDLYQDGIKVGNTDFCSGAYVGTENTTAVVNVGYDQSGDSWTGKLDQVCIFRGVQMNTAEIKELMTIRDVTQFTYYDSLVLYHEYDNDTTGTDGITDLSPAGNHGTMTNGEYTDLNVCVEWPYSYQLESNTTYSNLTPMQSSIESDSSYGGFGWDFDGAAEYTDFGDVTDYDGLTELSISAWVKSDVDFTTTYASIVGKDDDPDQRAFVLSGIEDGGNNTFRFLVSDDGTNTDRVTSGAVDNRQFNHVVGTWDTDSMKIYVNGILSSAIATTNATTGIANTTASLRFAKTQQPGTYLNGTIGDVFIYNGLLTHTQVKAIYKQHAPRNETNESLAGNIVGYWRGYNSTNVASGILDQSGNNLHGTPTNMDLADFQYTYPREIFDADTAGSVDFDGTTEYISVADSDSLSMLNAAGTADTAFSISAWVNMDVVAEFMIASKYGDDATREWYVGFINTSAIRMVLYDESENAAIGYNTTFTYNRPGQWVNLVWTYDGTGSIAGMNFYANGIQKSSFTDISIGSYTAMENLNTTLNIGHLASGSPIYSNGKMAHVTIMKGIELDLCQVQEINNGLIDVNTEFGGSPVDPRNWTFWSDDFIHYKLDQSEDLESTEGVTNISPNGSCNGTATNMTNAANKITTSFPTN